MEDVASKGEEKQEYSSLSEIAFQILRVNYDDGQMDQSKCVRESSKGKYRVSVEIYFVLIK